MPKIKSSINQKKNTRHLPIGVLFDLHGSESDLPWKITVHFQGFPENELVRIPDIKTLKSNFMNVLKEVFFFLILKNIPFWTKNTSKANYLKHGDGSKVNSLPLSDQDDLWDGLVSDNFDKYWKANRKLLAQMPAMKSAAVRIFKPDSKSFIQLPINPLKEGETSITLLEALQTLSPTQFPKEKTEEISFDPIIHGISMPLDTPLFWLSTVATHPDNFLYIMLKQKWRRI